MIFRMILLFLSMNISSLIAYEPLRTAAQKEAFIMKRLQDIIESQVHYAGNTFKGKEYQKVLAGQVSSAIGRIAAVGIIIASGVLRWPPKDWLSLLLDSMMIAFGAAAIGYWLDMACNPIVGFFVTQFYQVSDDSEEDAFVYSRALTEFVRNWAEFRPEAPAQLYAQLDALYLEYLQHGAQLHIKEDDAKRIIGDIIARCMQNQDSKVGETVV